MSRYDKFEDFMQDVIKSADEQCRAEYGQTLAEAYNVSASIITITEALIASGWWVFLAVAVLLAMGSLGFAATLVTFVLTPVGVIVLGVLAVFGGMAAMKHLYRSRVLPLAVKNTGEMYKEEFYRHLGDQPYIDCLIKKAACTLLAAALKKMD